MTVPSDLIEANPGIGAWAILHGYRGSIAHGMYEPSTEPNSIDDKDTMAICVPPRDYYMGLSEFGSRGTQEIKRGEWDIVTYEARKAIRLLAQGNPNILSLLWLPSEMILGCSAAGRALILHRDVFVGRHVYDSFVGYARGQLHKMENGAHRGYMGEKRKALVERHGYDTKNAAHLIRLLWMGIEFLTHGEMFVDRRGMPNGNADFLLAIKHGEWPLEKVKFTADVLFAAAEEVYVASKLPERPDPARVNTLCVEVVHTALGMR